MVYKIYLAGGWSFRKEIDEIRKDVLATGFEVCSHWTDRENGKTTSSALSDDAIEDFREISECNFLVAIMTDKKYEYRGCFTEIGYAIGNERRVVIVCDGVETRDGDISTYTHHCMTNVFYWHPSIRRFKTVADALKFLEVARNDE